MGTSGLENFLTFVISTLQKSQNPSLVEAAYLSKFIEAQEHFRQQSPDFERLFRAVKPLSNQFFETFLISYKSLELYELFYYDNVANLKKVACVQLTFLHVLPLL